MSVQYRLMRPEDEARDTFRDFQDAPQRFGRAHVAVADAGQILASVCYWLRDVRGPAGDPMRIGHLFHVATAPSARRQGHATHLLADSIQALSNVGCQWAILGARQEAAGLYARAGWQPTTRLYWRGAYSADTWPGRQRYSVDDVALYSYAPLATRHLWRGRSAAPRHPHSRRPTAYSGRWTRTDVSWSP